MKRGFAAMARSDTEVVVLLYEPDAEVWMHGMVGVGLSECYRGRDGVRTLYADIDDVFSEWRWTIHSVTDGGDRLVARDSRETAKGFQTRTGVERELKRFERRGNTARNRTLRQVKRTRTRVEREVRKRRTQATRL